jgi:hypothetical protein
MILIESRDSQSSGFCLVLPDRILSGGGWRGAGKRKEENGNEGK